MIDLKTSLKKFSGRKTLMTIYPHPDDESVAAGGILLEAKRYGWKTVVVCLTKGGAGKMLIDPHKRSIKEVREAELFQATMRLGVDEVVLGDFEDGKLRETRERWEPWVREAIKEHNPGIVVTYDRSGMTGHPDHISLSVALGEIFVGHKSPPRIFWTALPEGLRNKLVPESLWEYVSVPGYELSLGMRVVWKWWAIRSHRSQPLMTRFWLIPKLAAFLLNRKEWYYEVDLKKNYPYKYIEFEI